MPVPKRKTSKSRRDKRSSCKFIRPQIITACVNCQYPLPSHEACSQCGFYKGKKVITTKFERMLKRGEVRRVKQAKHVQTQQPEQDHSGHDHDQEQSA